MVVGVHGVGKQVKKGVTEEATASETKKNLQEAIIGLVVVNGDEVKKSKGNNADEPSRCKSLQP